MKLYKTKLGRIINFIKNEGKFKRGDLVEVLKNESEYKCYDKYIGQKAVVVGMDYKKKDNVVSLKFLDGEKFDYKPSELRKCDYKEETVSKEYRTLLKMI